VAYNFGAFATFAVIMSFLTHIYNNSITTQQIFTKSCVKPNYPWNCKKNQTLSLKIYAFHSVNLGPTSVNICRSKSLSNISCRLKWTIHLTPIRLALLHHKSKDCKCRLVVCLHQSYLHIIKLCYILLLASTLRW
jgi:hypothetical protein